MSKKYVLNSFAILAASALIGAGAQAEMHSGDHEKSVETQQEGSSHSGMDKQKMKEKMKEMHGKMHSESEIEEQAATDGDETTTETTTEIESETDTATTGEMDSTGGLAGETETTVEETREITTTEPAAEERPESTTAESPIETQPMEDSSVASMEREQIRSLQEKLNSELSANLVTDGIFGSQTRQALRQYQERNSLEVTGSPNQETLSSLGMSMDQESDRRPASVPTEPSAPESLEMDNEMEQEQSSPAMESEDSSINSEQLNEEVD